MRPAPTPIRSPDAGRVAPLAKATETCAPPSPAASSAEYPPGAVLHFNARVYPPPRSKDCRISAETPSARPTPSKIRPERGSPVISRHSRFSAMTEIHAEQTFATRRPDAPRAESSEMEAYTIDANLGARFRYAEMEPSSPETSQRRASQAFQLPPARKPMQAPAPSMSAEPFPMVDGVAAGRET